MCTRRYDGQVPEPFTVFNKNPLYFLGFLGSYGGPILIKFVHQYKTRRKAHQGGEEVPDNGYITPDYG
jgi:hypothetical protein